MKKSGSHKCTSTDIRENDHFEASKLLGTPFSVVLHNGVKEKYCTECGKILSHVIENPKELIAATAILRAFNPCKLSGGEIRFLRKSLGLRAKNLAAEISVSAETLSRFENDKQPISEAFEKLLRAAVCLRHVEEAQGLNVDISGLFSMKIPSVRSCTQNVKLHLTREDIFSNSEKYPLGVPTSDRDQTKWNNSHEAKRA